MEFSNLSSFLKLGYYLDYNNPQLNFDFSNVNKKQYQNLSEEKLIDIGSKILSESISESYSSKKSNVVPISGGLDSRAILGGLLQNTEAKNIETYTFGSPGTLDFEIGNYVAKKLGTRHTSLSLEDQVYSTNQLIDISQRFDHQTILFHHPPINILEEKYGNSIYWSGFMGGELAGGHFFEKEGQGILETYEHFIHNNTFVKSINLNRPDYDISEIYKLIDFNENIEEISLYEQIDFNNRQLKYIAPHILFKGTSYELPFLKKEWFNFILSVDNKYRKNEYLYKKILLRLFPHEFSLQTKTNHGASLSASSYEVFLRRVKGKISNKISGKNSNFNYLDFNREIRQNTSLQNVIRENLNDLSNRGILSWLNPVKILEDHVKKEIDYADALLVLCSLEIQIKSNKFNGLT